MENNAKDFSQFLHPELAELFEEYFNAERKEIERLRGLVTNLQETNELMIEMIDDLYDQLKKKETPPARKSIWRLLPWLKDDQ